MNYVIGITILAVLALLAFRWPELPIAVAGYGGWLIAISAQEASVSITLAVVLLITAGVMAAIWRGVRPQFGKFELAIIVFCAWGAGTLKYSTSPLYGEKKAYGLLGNSLYLVLAASFVLCDIKAIKRLLWEILLLSTLYVFASTFATSYVGTASQGRSALLDVTTGAGTASLALLLTGLWGVRNKALPPLSYAPIALAATFVLLSSGTRGAMVALVIAMGMGLYLIRTEFRKKPKLVILFGIGLVVVGLGIGLTRSYASPELVERLFVLENVATLNRGWNYEMALELGLRDPIFGLGIGGFKGSVLGEGTVLSNVTELDANPLYPHNIVLEVFVEFGLIGLALFAILGAKSWGAISSVLQAGVFNKEIGVESVVVSVLFVFGFVLALSALDIVGNAQFWGGLGVLCACHKVLRLKTNRKTTKRECLRSIRGRARINTDERQWAH